MSTHIIKTPALTRVKAKSQVTLPAHIKRALGVEEGDLLEASISNGTIVLRLKRIFDRDSVDGAIAEGLHDLKAGRVRGPYKNMADFKKSRTVRRS